MVTRLEIGVDLVIVRDFVMFPGVTPEVDLLDPEAALELEAQAPDLVPGVLNKCRRQRACPNISYPTTFQASFVHVRLG